MPGILQVLYIAAVRHLEVNLPYGLSKLVPVFCFLNRFVIGPDQLNAEFLQRSRSWSATAMFKAVLPSHCRQQSIRPFDLD
jgi:hypothetical protein